MSRRSKNLGAPYMALAVAWVFGVALLGGPAEAVSSTVEVCHFPPGTPDDFHTVTISESALAAHLEHGDRTGACNALCASICDDGDACTVDDTGDCEQVGCPTVSIPVDCDDSLGCTEDSCDSVLDCQSVPIICGLDETCSPALGICLPNGECPCWGDATALLECHHPSDVLSSCIAADEPGTEGFGTVGLITFAFPSHLSVTVVGDEIGGQGVLTCAMNCRDILFAILDVTDEEGLTCATHVRFATEHLGCPFP